jgi:hypothetical protein
MLQRSLIEIDGRERVGEGVEQRDQHLVQAACESSVGRVPTVPGRSVPGWGGATV